MGIKRSHRDSSSSDSTPYSRETSVDIKIVHLDTESAISDEPTIMKCSLPPHEPLAFASIEDHDVHYQQVHMNRCSECHKNFPDQHYLHLHIAEYHDPINAAKRDQGEKTYACLLPECDRMCSTPQKRRLHCIDKHQFPREFDFIVVKDGIDRRSSMLIPSHRRRSSTMSSASNATGRRRGESNASIVGDTMDTDQDEGDTRRYPTKLHGRGGFGGRGLGREEAATVTATKPATAVQSADPMDSLTSSMSSLKFIPHSVRVARGRGRGIGA
ncbi:unnamed protein product [Alternaria alternata]|uniref:Uncharacterized protein n=1 Tax=Alternaria gaisen TaxID=167740 RepID=A0ACB6G2P4_9PLEO|nr:hypothetical protein AG0111_0g2356 [Alternaria gaisen]OWY42395.1 metal ion binding protein [Alternaria alternata]